jgi:hypothetical protein
MLHVVEGLQHVVHHLGLHLDELLQVVALRIILVVGVIGLAVRLVTSHVHNLIIL